MRRVEGLTGPPRNKAWAVGASSARVVLPLEKGR